MKIIKIITLSIGFIVTTCFADGSVELIAKKNSTKIYSKNNISSYALGRVDQGERVQLLTDKGSWLLVDSPYGTGWIKKGDFTKLASQGTTVINNNNDNGYWYPPIYPIHPTRPPSKPSKPKPTHNTNTGPTYLPPSRFTNSPNLPPLER